MKKVLSLTLLSTVRVSSFEYSAEELIERFAAVKKELQAGASYADSIKKLQVYRTALHKRLSTDLNSSTVPLDRLSLLFEALTLFSDNLAILKLNQASLSEQLHILQNFERDFRTCEFKFASILIKHLPRATKKVEGPYKRITVQPDLEIYYRKMNKRYNSDHHKKGTAKRVRLDLHTKYVLKKPLLRECAPYLTPEQFLILEAWTEAYKQNKAGGVPSKIVLIEKCKTRFESGKIALIRPALIEPLGVPDILIPTDTVKDRLIFCRDIFQALLTMAETRQFSQDIKGSNFLGINGVMKAGDFGIAVSLGELVTALKLQLPYFMGTYPSPDLAERISKPLTDDDIQHLLGNNLEKAMGVLFKLAVYQTSLSILESLSHKKVIRSYEVRQAVFDALTYGNTPQSIKRNCISLKKAVCTAALFNRLFGANTASERLLSVMTQSLSLRQDQRPGIQSIRELVDELTTTIETIQEARPSVPKRSTSMKKTPTKHQQTQPKKAHHPITLHLATGVSSGRIKDDSVEVY